MHIAEYVDLDRVNRILVKLASVLVSAKEFVCVCIKDFDVFQGRFIYRVNVC